MQTNTLNTQELAECLDQSRILEIIDIGAMRQYVVEYSGQDILVIEAGGESIAIYPEACFDAESGGGIHDQARAILEAANDDNIHVTV